jgi:hypothetical protein
MKKFILSITLVAVSALYTTAQILYPVPCDSEHTKYGYINSKGKLVVPCKFEVAENFSNGLGLVYTNGKYGFIDATGAIVIPATLDKANSFSNGYAWVSSGGTGFFIDKQQNRYEVDNVAKGYEFVSDELVMIYVNGKYGFSNLNNELIIPAEYTKMTPFNNGLAIAQKKEKYFFIDKSAKETPLDYPEMKKYKDGLIATKGSNKKWGYINEKNEKMIDFLFQFASDFSEGYAVVADDVHEGLINKRGEIVLKIENRNISTFTNGMCVVVKDDFTLEIYDQNMKQVKSIKGIESGVNFNYYYNDELCMFHLMHKDPNSPDKLIRQYGGVKSVYMDKTGKIVWQSVPWYSCFPGNAVVTMSDFTTRKISEIGNGDEILSYDFSSKEYISSTVTDLEVHEGNYDLITIEVLPGHATFASASIWSFATNKIIEVTPNHPLLTSEGKIAAGLVKQGDEVYTWNELDKKFELQKVVSVRENNSSDRVYNLRTTEANYVVDGVVVMMK